MYDKVSKINYETLLDAEMKLYNWNEFRLHFFFLPFLIIVTHTSDSDAADSLYHKNVQLHYKFILSAK